MPKRFKAAADLRCKCTKSSAGKRERARLADLGRLVKVHFGRRGPRLTGTAEEKMPLFPRRHATCHLAIALINALLHEGLATSAPNSIDILA
ncbi:hypothetical protein MES5069_190071 [Mesorhizobium escarrei]|uniref:Transposase DDE domain-containing protein n=1 Tax=Mesorhizobium escarrei TaxID=666018 RepID=A0ABN8JIW5_9HYPH|nr:hypothetical protein MES5069_190071 [Mesorhizobium escarrei]